MKNSWNKKKWKYQPSQSDKAEGHRARKEIKAQITSSKGAIGTDPMDVANIIKIILTNYALQITLDILIQRQNLGKN
jgi:hypothetical protein